MTGAVRRILTGVMEIRRNWKSRHHRHTGNCRDVAGHARQPGVMDFSVRQG